MRVLATLVIAAGCTTSPAGGAWEPPTDQVSTFWLPTNSPRLGASGRVSPRYCVGLVWNFTGKALGRHCDDFEADFPYAVVIASEEPCDETWAYQPNTAVSAIHGCIEPTDVGAALDITASISGSLFAGDIHLVAP